MLYFEILFLFLITVTYSSIQIQTRLKLYTILLGNKFKIKQEYIVANKSDRNRYF